VVISGPENPRSQKSRPVAPRTHCRYNNKRLETRTFQIVSAVALAPRPFLRLHRPVGSKRVINSLQRQPGLSAVSASYIDPLRLLPLIGMDRAHG
jgi:hypothetical protein